jgi:hypothetical protein
MKENAYTLPKKWPASLDEFLRRVVKRRHVDRVKIYREFIRIGLRNENFKRREKEGVSFEDIPIPETDEANKVIAEHRQSKFTEEQFIKQAYAFKIWEPTLRHDRARKASDARWKKNRLAPSKISQKSVKHPAKLYQASRRLHQASRRLR